jgi:transcription antitermination factor NusG
MMGRFPGDSKNSGYVPAIDHYRPKWFVIHTRSRHEKRVTEQLQMKRIEVFFPMYRSKRHWGAREAVVDLPLFPGYVFVHIPLAERLNVLGLSGVAGLVLFQGAPAPVPDDELESLRECLSRTPAEPIPYYQPGNRVRIISGPLAGLEGVIVRNNGQTRFVLSINLIMRSIAVNVDACDLAPVATPAEIGVGRSA